MDVRKEIKKLLAEEADTLTNIAEQMSAVSAKPVTMNNLSKKLRKGTIKFAEVQLIVNLLGYDVKFEKKKQ